MANRNVLFFIWMKNMASNDLFLIVKSFILFVISQFPFV